MANCFSVLLGWGRHLVVLRINYSVEHLITIGE